MEEAYLRTDLHTYLPQGPPISEGWTNSQPSDILPYPQNLQVHGEAYQCFPFICPSNPMNPIAFPYFTPSTLKSKGFRVASDEDPTLFDVDVARMNTPSGQSHQLAPVDTVPNFLASSTFPTVSCTPTALQSQQQSASQDKLQRSHLLGEGTPATSRSHRQRSRICGTPKRPYSCDICGKSYAQPQGVTRHHREAHRASVCMYCGDFRWGRPYQFRKHIKERHPDIDPDTVVFGRTRSRPKATMISKRSAPRQRVFSNHEHDRRGRVESHLIPLAPPPSAVAEVTPLASPPIMPSLDSDPQPQPPEQINVTQTHEDPRDLWLDATNINTSAAISSTEFVQGANGLETTFQDGQTWYQSEVQSGHQGESNAAGCQSNPYYTSPSYRLLVDIMAAQSSWSLWLNRLYPRVLHHSPVQIMMDPASLVP